MPLNKTVSSGSVVSSADAKFLKEKVTHEWVTHMYIYIQALLFLCMFYTLWKDVPRREHLVTLLLLMVWLSHGTRRKAPLAQEAEDRNTVLTSFQENGLCAVDHCLLNVLSWFSKWKGCLHYEEMIPIPMFTMIPFTPTFWGSIPLK